VLYHCIISQRKGRKTREVRKPGYWSFGLSGNFTPRLLPGGQQPQFIRRLLFRNNRTQQSFQQRQTHVLPSRPSRAHRVALYPEMMLRNTLHPAIFFSLNQIFGSGGIKHRRGTVGIGANIILKAGKKDVRLSPKVQRIGRSLYSPSTNLRIFGSRSQQTFPAKS
jgi:hypothetical protein